MRTPQSRVKEPAEKIQALVGKLDGARDLESVAAVCAELREVQRCWRSATAIEAKSEQV